MKMKFLMQNGQNNYKISQLLDITTDKIYIYLQIAPKALIDKIISNII